MPLLSTTARRNIERFAAQEDARIHIEPIPEIIRQEQRIACGIRADYTFHRIFSVFVAPDLRDDAVTRWQAAVDEMTILFNQHHASAAARLAERTRRAELRAAWYATLDNVIEHDVKTIFMEGVDTEKISVKYGGQILRQATVSYQMRQSPYSYRNEIRCYGFVTIMTKSGDAWEVRQQAYHDTTKDGCREQIVSGLKQYMVQQVASDLENAALASGTPFEWQQA